MIVFNTSMLDRALAQYTRYEPTASEYLRETREKWIPIKVEDASKPRICKIASDILEGGVYDSYEAILSEEYKIAICLTLFQAYAEYMANLMLSGVSTETLYTQRVFGFLGVLPVDYQALAIRNAGSREHGSFTMNLIQHFQLIRVPEVMKVYLGIRSKWTARGYDRDRPHREEIAQAW